MLRIGTWNSEWAEPGKAKGQRFRVALADPGCNILCVTEGYRKILPRGGHVIDAGREREYHSVKGRRKVLLWSRRRWTEVHHAGGERPLGGRYVAGTTETEAGALRVVGVCIPWRDAHVTTGAKDSRPWEEHGKWLAEFETLPCRTATGKTVVLGDFNQRIPRVRQERKVYEALRRAFAGFTIATAGRLAGTRIPAIDHIAHTADLTVIGEIGIWPGRSERGKRISDHFGVWCDFDDFDASSVCAGDIGG